MLTRLFDPRRLLRLAYGTEPFADYCRSRGIALEQMEGFAMRAEDYHRWQAALAQLPEAGQAQVELDLAQVHELARPETLGQLLVAAQGRELPPDSVPGDVPLALWFFLQYPDLFREVLHHHELAEAGSWRTAQAPAGIPLPAIAGRCGALAATLKDFFRMHEGTGRFCAVDAYQLHDCACFVAHVSNRLHLLELFTDDG